MQFLGQTLFLSVLNESYKSYPCPKTQNGYLYFFQIYLRLNLVWSIITLLFCHLASIQLNNFKYEFIILTHPPESCLYCMITNTNKSKVIFIDNTFIKTQTIDTNKLRYKISESSAGASSLRVNDIIKRSRRLTILLVPFVTVRSLHLIK